MTRECHVRFSEGVGVGFPRATRPPSLCPNFRSSPSTTQRSVASPRVYAPL